MMPPWNKRPAETANLLNPAFVGVLLRKAIDGYTAESEAGMPFELIFLVLPLSLHPPTAARLPSGPGQK
jgi:ABC-3C biological conflict system middle component